MGVFYSCCLRAESSPTIPTPDAETRRLQQLEAAEKRRKEQESRGVKDPGKLRRQQQRQEEMESRQEQILSQGQQGGGGLKWQMN